MSIVRGLGQHKEAYYEVFLLTRVPSWVLGHIFQSPGLLADPSGTDVAVIFGGKRSVLVVDGLSFAPMLVKTRQI